MKSNNSSGLIALLTVLLVSCAIVEASIASYVGVTMQINRQANEEAAARYKEYQAQLQQEPAAVQYIGPGVQVKNGQVVKGAIPGSAPAQPVVAEPEWPTEYVADAEQPQEVAPEREDTVTPSKKPEAPSKAQNEFGSGQKAADPPKVSNGGGSSPSGGNVATTKNSDGTYKHDFSGGRVLGTKNSDKYHNSDCIGARKIPPENEVWYSSVSDAVAAGREACGSCYR